VSPAQTLWARPVGPTWYPPVQSTVQPFGFDGGGFRPLRMSQRRDGGELEYAQPMLCDGVWKKTNFADAEAGSSRARTTTSRSTSRR